MALTAVGGKGGRDRLLYNVACIYALAAGQAELEARAGRDREARGRLEMYVGKASQCLAQAMEARPRDKQAAFWREIVRNDPALAAIRRGTMYAQLETKYGTREEERSEK